jgi:hypothetical protein
VAQGSGVTLLHDSFEPGPLPHWMRYLVGEAQIEQTLEGLRLVLDGATASEYSDSQLDDYQNRDNFLWTPPLRLAVRARFSHSQETLQGTAGFGWWNAPFRRDRATEIGVGPQVLWFFFGSPPNKLAATSGWSGDGWFAQVMNVPPLPGWLVKAGMLTLRLPFIKRFASKAAAGTSRAAEQPLREMDITEWHDYVVEWRDEAADFYVDGHHILRADAPPSGPLALVLWMDNQWANVQGGGGLLDVPQRQWLELSEVTLTTL